MGVFGLWVAFEIAPELLDNGRTFCEHKEGKNEDENKGGDEAGERADTRREVGAKVLYDRRGNALNVVYDVSLEMLDADGFAKIVEPAEAIRNGFDGFWQVFGKIDAFVYDGRNDDGKEGGETTNDNKIGDCDWQFDAFARNDFCELTHERVDGEGNEERGADNEKAGRSFEKQEANRSKAEDD